MAKRKPKQVLYRRKREQKTDYKKRLTLLLSQKQRLVLRFSNTKITAQIVEFNTQGDKVLLGLDSSKLRQYGWNYSLKNIPAAYLTGLLFGKEASSKKDGPVILDTGFVAPLKKGKYYAFLKGALEAGLDIPHGGEEIFPDAQRISGEHIKAYYLQSKTNNHAFTEYLKKGAQPEALASTMDKIKKKIMSQ